MNYYVIEEEGFEQVIGHEKEFTKEVFVALYNEAVRAIKGGYKGFGATLNSDKIISYLCDVHDFEHSSPFYKIILPEDVLEEIDLNKKSETEFEDFT